MWSELDSVTNRKAISSSSSVRTGTSLHGLHRTCLVYRENSPSTSCTFGQARSRSSNPCDVFSEDKRRAIGEEITKLQAEGFIMEVFYPEWLSNPVLVMNKNKTWRMCI